MSKEIEFIGTIVRNIYMSDNFKSYAVNVDKTKYPDVKYTKYGNCSVSGNIQSLSIGEEYIFSCIEQNDSKYGYSYKIKNIKKDKPRNEHDVYQFLQEFLTLNQANQIYKYYPNIIDMVLNNETDKIDFSKLNGIGEFTFNRIKQKIIDNYMLFDLVAEYGDALSITVMKKLYDKYPSIEKIRTEMCNRPYTCLTSVSGIGFKKADGILLDMEKKHIVNFKDDLKISLQRCLAACEYLLLENENSEGSTCMDISELRKQIIKLVPACSDKFVESLKDDLFYYNKESMLVSLKSTYNTELYIANSIKERANVNNVWDFDVNKYNTINGIELSEEQIGFLDAICKNQITVLSAPGGTGKSFTTKAAINMLKDNNIKFLLFSPTGKAARKLSEYTNEETATIHRGLGYTPNGFNFNEENQLFADIVFVDEIGMTDIRLFVHLLKAIPSSTKIVLIGDNFQLNSIGSGALLRDLLNCKCIKHVHFTHVYRLGEGGALTACTYVRQNKSFLTDNKLTFLGDDKSYVFIPSNKNNINKNILEVYKKLLNTYQSKDITVISALNVGDNGCDALNKLLQPFANPLSTKLGTNKITIKQDNHNIVFYEGDIVIQNVNNYRAKKYQIDDLGFNNDKEEVFIPNGTQGIITKIENGSAIIEFDDTLIEYTSVDLNNVKHSFAVNTFKMQGSQNKVILFCMPYSQVFFLNNNLVYTSLSRAENTIYHFTDVQTMKIAMGKSDNKRRKTWLSDMLNK